MLAPSNLSASGVVPRNCRLSPLASRENAETTFRYKSLWTQAPATKLSNKISKA